MSKPKIGLYWCASCGGCEESVVDVAENILVVAQKADIVFWPVAMDFKYKDVEALADGELAATLINGAVRTSEQEYLVKLLRKKSKVIVAHGSCAHLGGIVGLANFSTRNSVLERAFKEVSTMNNPQGILPKEKSEENGKELELPYFYNTVRTLNQVIDVDYYLPGCPPPPQLVAKAILTLLDGPLPPKGSVLADTKALCDTCSRRDTKPTKIKLKRFKRVYEVEIDPERCFLDQGIICMGPVTRGGCEERCIKANYPCRGCFGPLDNVKDMGAKALSFIVSLIDSNDEKEIKEIIESIPDASGLFYRYGLAASLLKGKKGES